MRGWIWVSLLLAAPVFGAEAPPLDSLLASHFEARGGLEAIRAVKSIRATGKRMSGTGENRFVWEWKRPNKIRIEFEHPQGKIIQGYDGKRGWVILPGESKPRDLRPELVARFDQEADFDGALVDAAAKGHTVSVLGLESVGGIQAYKLRVRLAGGDEQDVWLDASSMLEMKRVNRLFVGSRTVEAEVEVGGYRRNGPLVVAHRYVTRAIGSDEVTAMTFESMTLDVPIDDARFTQP